MSTATPIYDSLARPVARKNDRITSVIAGESVAAKSTAREDVLMLLKAHGPMHDEALVESHEAYVSRGQLRAKSPQRIRTARAELVDAGFVHEVMDGPDVRTVRLRSGYHSVVWEAAR